MTPARIYFRAFDRTLLIVADETVIEARIGLQDARILAGQLLCAVLEGQDEQNTSHAFHEDSDVRYTNSHA